VHNHRPYPVAAGDRIAAAPWRRPKPAGFDGYIAMHDKFVWLNLSPDTIV
jgi:hypothetical protein